MLPLYQFTICRILFSNWYYVDDGDGRIQEDYRMDAVARGVQEGLNAANYSEAWKKGHPRYDPKHPHYPPLLNFSPFFGQGRVDYFYPSFLLFGR